MELDMLIPILIAGICTGISVFGVIRKSADMLRLGLFMYSVMVTALNLAGHIETGGQGELFTAALFAVQAIFSYPKYPEPDFANPSVQAFGVRIALCIFTINAFSAYMALTVVEFPSFVAIFHGVYCAIALMRLVQINKS